MPAAPDLQIVRQAPLRFDLAKSQRALQLGLFDPGMRIEHGVVWRATRTPVGPATYRAQATDRGIHLSVWGEGSGWIEANVDALLGWLDRPEAFSPSDTIVRAELRRVGPVHLPRTRRVFERLVPVVLQQLVTWREAMRAYRLIVARWGEDAPGPARLRLAPDAAAIAATPAYAMTPLGVLARQARTLVRLARMSSRLEAIADDDPTTARAKLESIEGVGPWTSALVTAAVHGDPDAVPVGDFHLSRDIGWALARDRDADDAGMLRLLAPFAGHRWRAITLLRRKGLRPARRGPRRPMRPLPGAR